MCVREKWKKKKKMKKRNATRYLHQSLGFPWSLFRVLTVEMLPRYDKKLTKIQWKHRWANKDKMVGVGKPGNVRLKRRKGVNNKGTKDSRDDKVI